MAQTLLSMAGASYSKSNLSKAVLVMIDCQQQYVDHALVLLKVATSAAKSAKALARVHDAYVHQRHCAGSLGPGFWTTSDSRRCLRDP